MSSDDNNARPSSAGQARPAGFCVTRALKNAHFLQRVAPTIIPTEEPPEGFGSIVPIETLARLSQVPEPAALLANPAHRAAMKQVSFPQVTASLADPMFNGTVYLTRITFTPAFGSYPPAAVDETDMQTARAFLALAAPKISAYASQYGGNLIDISPRILEFTASLGPPAFGSYLYNDANLQTWVNEIASQNGLSDSDCVVVLNPQAAINADAQASQGIGGYHKHANLPYAFINVMGSGLTIADTDQFYALALSHEIAEMTVDMLANLKNPEVCDPCGPNCQNVFIDYFDDIGGYIQTVQAAGFPPGPPPFTYSFYINGIVQPASATSCPAPSTACTYAPPTYSPQAGANSAIISLLLPPRPVTLVPSLAAVLL